MLSLCRDGVYARREHQKQRLRITRCTAFEERLEHPFHLSEAEEEWLRPHAERKEKLEYDPQRGFFMPACETVYTSLLEDFPKRTCKEVMLSICTLGFYAERKAKRAGGPRTGSEREPHPAEAAFVYTKCLNGPECTNHMHGHSQKLIGLRLRLLRAKLKRQGLENKDGKQDPRPETKYHECRDGSACECFEKASTIDHGHSHADERRFAVAQMVEEAEAKRRGPLSIDRDLADFASTLPTIDEEEEIAPHLRDCQVIPGAKSLRREHKHDHGPDGLASETSAARREQRPNTIQTASPITHSALSAISDRRERDTPQKIEKHTTSTDPATPLPDSKLSPTECNALVAVKPLNRQPPTEVFTNPSPTSDEDVDRMSRRVQAVKPFWYGFFVGDGWRTTTLTIKEANEAVRRRNNVEVSARLVGDDRGRSYYNDAEIQQLRKSDYEHDTLRAWKIPFERVGALSRVSIRLEETTIHYPARGQETTPICQRMINAVLSKIPSVYTEHVGGGTLTLTDNNRLVQGFGSRNGVLGAAGLRSVDLLATYYGHTVNEVVDNNLVTFLTTSKVMGVAVPIDTVGKVSGSVTGKLRGALRLYPDQGYLTHNPNIRDASMQRAHNIVILDFLKLKMVDPSFMGAIKGSSFAVPVKGILGQPLPSQYSLGQSE
jgi:hypothetical protein